MNYSFEENEMPFDILERFGLTQTMIEDLPTDVLQNIYNGRSHQSCLYISRQTMVKK